jgi:MoaA/NifB/PqqE/SkfB family radical SAM enzyme
MRRRYYLRDRPRGLFRRVSDHLLRKPFPAIPETVLIETLAGCNARCVFCPIGDEEIRRGMPMGRMSAELFHGILDQLAAAPPRHVIPCFANEPFLDKRLIDWLIALRERVPTSKVTVVTNGSLLTEEVSRRLLDTGVPDLLSISFQGLDKASYEASMGTLDFDETLERVLRLLAMKRERAARRPDVKVNMIATKLVADGIREARRFWREQGVELDVDTVENRGGSVPLTELAGTTVPYTDCRRPFNTLVITFDGEVPVCCVDFQRKAIVGDVRTQSIQDIWHGERLMAIRGGFLDETRRYQLPKICRDCRLAD